MTMPVEECKEVSMMVMVMLWMLMLVRLMMLMRRKKWKDEQKYDRACFWRVQTAMI